MAIRKLRKYLGNNDKHGRRKHEEQHTLVVDEEKEGFRVQEDKHGINNEVAKYGCIKRKTVR